MQPYPMDLAPYLSIDLKKIESNVRQINPHVTMIPVSAQTGEGLETWFKWIESNIKLPSTQSSTVQT